MCYPLALSTMQKACACHDIQQNIVRISNELLRSADGEKLGVVLDNGAQLPFWSTIGSAIGLRVRGIH